MDSDEAFKGLHEGATEMRQKLAGAVGALLADAALATVVDERKQEGTTRVPMEAVRNLMFGLLEIARALLAGDPRATKDTLPALAMLVADHTDEDSAAEVRSEVAIGVGLAAGTAEGLGDAVFTGGDMKVVQVDDDMHDADKGVGKA